MLPTYVVRHRAALPRKDDTLAVFVAGICCLEGEFAIFKQPRCRHGFVATLRSTEWPYINFPEEHAMAPSVGSTEAVQRLMKRKKKKHDMTDNSDLL